MTALRPADLVLRGGAVHTVDPARPRAQAVAVRGGRIVAVGTDADVGEHMGPRTRVVELRGRTLLPGFQDAHVHAVTAGLDRLRCDLRGGADDAETYLARVGEYAAAHPERRWIVGGGWAMGAFPGGTPDRGLLDAVVPDRPVCLDNRDGHGVWVNSRALELAGIDRHTPDPVDGRIERDADGQPQGTLHEGATALIERHIPQPTAEEWLASARLGQAELHRLGITAWQETSGYETDLGAYRTLAERGELTARVVVAQRWQRDAGLEQLDAFAARRDRSRIGRLRADRLKILLDGVLENFTGAMLEPYLDANGSPTTNRGLLFLEPVLLREVVRRADGLGFHVHVHAIGDRAVREALDAFEAASASNPARDRRHTIAHIQVIHPADLARFAALGVVANGQPYWAVSERQMDVLTIPFLGPERTGWQYPFGSLLRAGARLAFGSDWAVSTPNPLEEIEVAVRRVSPDDRHAAAFLPHERITLRAAVEAFTLGAAYVNGLDEETGTITAGKLADLAVLDRDLFAPGTLPDDARVLLTLVEGAPVFEDPALEG
ncbi:MAG: amidohydrolase [Chloroflexi bacterium CSP1-4]|nr:MAG: amidohydrolase [Chloroflexi bacterium CSP1-4]